MLVNKNDSVLSYRGIYHFNDELDKLKYCTLSVLRVCSADITPACALTAARVPVKLRLLSVLVPGRLRWH